MIKLKLGQETMNPSGAKLPIGKFRVRLEKVLVKPSKRFDTPGDKCVVEFDVVKVYNKTPGKNWKGDPLDANVGDRRSWTVDMAKGDIALGNLTAFTIACFGIHPRDAAAVKAAVGPDGTNMNAPDASGDTGWAKMFYDMQGPANPARGLELDVEVRQQQTDKNRTIMPHEWTPVSEEQAAA